MVADVQNNKLLVRANPLDLYTVRKMVGMIDVPDTNSKMVIKTHYIRLKEAVATEVAEVIKDVYRESMNTTPRGAVQAILPGGGVVGRNLSRTWTPTAIHAWSC